MLMLVLRGCRFEMMMMMITAAEAEKAVMAIEVDECGDPKVGDGSEPVAMVERNEWLDVGGWAEAVAEEVVVMVGLLVAMGVAVATVINGIEVGVGGATGTGVVVLLMVTVMLVLRSQCAGVSGLVRSRKSKR